ncbi:MAG TPA: histone deacetylase [Ilumatobacter sp.]|nr:histone deacetylase [Ilumatobacter sp.]
MVSPLTVFADVEHDAHHTPAWHPERHARLEASVAGVATAGLADAATWKIPRLASVEELALVHGTDYIAAVERLCESGGGEIDGDTSVSSGSFNTARQSAGAVLDALDELRSGATTLAFAAGRPPGHHAVRSQAMGFCLFNNAAIGAASLTARGERVAIVDWDVHHGNGTQDIFYDDPNVLYVSTHESPLYPGTGRMREQGGPMAPGTTCNLPFPAGTAGDTYRAAFDEVVVPLVERFQPDWLIISAGFDAHRSDPLAGLALTADDYADLAQRLVPLVSTGRLLVVLEGGYDTTALERSTGATLSSLLGESYRPEGVSTGTVGRETIAVARALWEF